MKKIFILIVFLFLSSIPGYNQEKLTDEEQFEDAEFFFATEEYEEALYIFKSLVNKHPGNANLNFRTGMTYLKIEGQEKFALPYFQEAVKNTNLKYKKKSYSVKVAPHHAWFYLGNAYRINNELDKALESYQIFKDIKKFEKRYNTGIVENEIKACERAKIIKDNSINFHKENLGKQINTGGKSFQPVVNLNETSLCYMVVQKFYDAIMYSVKTDDEWSRPVNITPLLGSDGDMFPAAFSANGNELLLVQRTNSSNGSIYYSKKVDGQWTIAQKLNKNINSSADEAHASFSSDGNSIIFSSSRKGGTGGLDLYISKKQDDGNWGTAENMGPVLNSPKDETSAFLLSNDSLIYFASKGHFNMGGFDIFYSKKDENGQWIAPVNFGYPLNTTGSNSFYQPVANGKSGYTALFDKNNIGQEDIYKIEILPFITQSTPKKSKFKEDFTIYLEDNERGELIKLNYNKKTDTISVSSNLKSNYNIRIKKQ